MRILSILILAALLAGCTNPAKTDGISIKQQGPWEYSFVNDGWAVFYYITAPDSHEYVSISRGGLCHAVGCRKCAEKDSLAACKEGE